MEIETKQKENEMEKLQENNMVSEKQFRFIDSKTILTRVDDFHYVFITKYYINCCAKASYRLVILSNNMQFLRPQLGF